MDKLQQYSPQDVVPMLSGLTPDGIKGMILQIKKGRTEREGSISDTAEILEHYEKKIKKKKQLYFTACSDTSHKDEDVISKNHFPMDLDIVENYKELGLDYKNIDWQEMLEDIVSRLDNAKYERIKNYYLIVHSGNGYHLYYRDVNILTGKQASDYKQTRLYLAKQLGEALELDQYKLDPAVKNIGRLMRLPFSLNTNCETKHGLPILQCKPLIRNKDAKIDIIGKSELRKSLTKESTQSTPSNKTTKKGNTQSEKRTSPYQGDLYRKYNYADVGQVINKLFGGQIKLSRNGKSFEGTDGDHKSFFLNKKTNRIIIQSDSKRLEKEWSGLPLFELVMRFLKVDDKGCEKWFNENLIVIDLPDIFKYCKKTGSINGFDPYLASQHIFEKYKTIGVEGAIAYYKEEDGIFEFKNKQYDGQTILHLFQKYAGTLDLMITPISISSTRFLLIQASESEKLKNNLKTNDPNFDICLQEGIYDAKTKEIREYTPDELKLSKFDFSAELLKETNEPTRFLDFLKEVFDDKKDHLEEIIPFLQEYIGSLFLDYVIDSRSLFFMGSGGNGKGVLLEVIINLLGVDNCCNVAINELNKDQNRFLLIGKHLMYDSDVAHNTRLDTGIMKQITQNEIITVKKLYAQPINIRPKTRVILCSNVKPKIRNVDNSITRRFVIMKFEQSFLGKKSDPELKQKLYAERDQIFARAVKGLSRYLERGKFQIPKIFAQATEEYVREFDSVQCFLDELNGTEIKLVSTGTAGVAGLHALYHNYCYYMGYDPLGRKEFSHALKNKGYKTKRIKEGYVFQGIHLV